MSNTLANSSSLPTTHSESLEIPLEHLNSVKTTTHLILFRSNSTSTMIGQDPMSADSNPLPTTLLTHPSASLRSLLKTSGLFNKDVESSDHLNEFFANGNEFTLHRLLSDIAGNDIPIDMNDLVKFDPSKLLDVRSLSELLSYDTFDQINPSSQDLVDEQNNQLDGFSSPANACLSGSFSELYPATPELINSNEVFQIDGTELKVELEQPLIYTELNSLENFTYTPSTATSIDTQFNFDPNVLAAYEHDYGVLSKPSTTIVNTPTPSPTSIVSKRSPIRGPRRTSSRLQSRATLINFNDILNDNACLSPTPSEDSSISIRRTRRTPSVSRAVDIKSEDDLSYYLERRRKNNEASKMSRAARKQKYDDMDAQCAEYERDNADLRLKLSTLEVVTATLKNGLIHSFQRKNALDSKR